MDKENFKFIVFVYSSISAQRNAEEDIRGRRTRIIAELLIKLVILCSAKNLWKL